MNILIPVLSPVTGTWGGLTRAIAIAKSAEKVGHKVAFCASGYLSSSLKQSGNKVYSMPESTFMGMPKTISKLIAQRSQRSSLPVRPGRDFGNIWFVQLLSGLTKPGYLNQLVDAELHAACDFKADFLFTDLDPGVFLVARILKLPIASAYQTPMARGINTLPWKLVNRVVNIVLKSHNLDNQPVDELFYGPKVLKIIPSISELEGTDPERVDVCYTGQLLGDIQPGKGFQPEPGKRYIFAYLGTGAVPLQKARLVLPQVFREGGPYICLVGSQGITSVEKIGAVEFHPYVPATGVLPHCDWTICHGGQNTIIQSLINGVPLMVFPGPIFERRFNARKVQEAGVGKMGELTDFNVEWIQAAMQDQSSKAMQARLLGERIQSYGGADAAVSAMERWRVG